jgi:hypothetical protein
MRRLTNRRATWTRLLFVLGAIAVLALAALLLRGAFTDQEASRANDASVSTTSAIGAHDSVTSSLHAYHPVAVMRARGVALAMLAVATAIVACTSRRLRTNRSQRRRTFRVVGLPRGRAPPRLRIA